MKILKKMPQMKKWIISCGIIVLLLSALCACRTQPEHTLEFIEAKALTVEDRDLVGAFCTYTNLSEYACLPCDAINIRAYQNGVEIPVMVFTGQEVDGFVQCDTSVQAGATASVIWLFEYKERSTVTFEFSDGQSHSFNFAAE